MEPYPLIEIDGETPYERGLQYGRQAKERVGICIEYYKKSFAKQGFTWEKAMEYAADGQFPPGSMLPKIQAVVDYVRTLGGVGIITDPEHLSDAIDGCGGTRIVR